MDIAGTLQKVRRLEEANVGTESKNAALDKELGWLICRHHLFNIVRDAVMIQFALTVSENSTTVAFLLSIYVFE